MSLHERIEASFARQGLMQHLGAKLLSVGDGEVSFSLPMSPLVTQQQGAFHGGTIAALADICCGYAALTQGPADAEVASVEFKINFCAAATGSQLTGLGQVVKAGRTLAVTRAEIFDHNGDRRTLCAVMQATMIYVAKRT